MKKNYKREGSENAETLERDLGDTHTGVHFSRDITLVAPRHNQNELTWRKLLPTSHSCRLVPIGPTYPKFRQGRGDLAPRPSTEPHIILETVELQLMIEHNFYIYLPNSAQVELWCVRSKFKSYITTSSDLGHLI